MAETSQYPPTPDEKLVELGKELAAGRLFTSQHIHEPDMIPRVFLVLAFMDAASRDAMVQADIAVLYERLDQAGPRSINGYPIFFSCGMLTEAEWNRVVEVSEKAKAALAAIA